MYVCVCVCMYVYMYAAFAAHELLLQAGGGGTTAGEHYYSYYICVLILQHVSSYHSTCVLILLYIRPAKQALVQQAGAGAVLILTRLLEAAGLQTRTMGRKRG